MIKFFALFSFFIHSSPVFFFKKKAREQPQQTKKKKVSCETDKDEQEILPKELNLSFDF